jgi:hypothetical protein
MYGMKRNHTGLGKEMVLLCAKYCTFLSMQSKFILFWTNLFNWTKSDVSLSYYGQNLS